MEHIWTIENWVKILNENGEKSRKGLRLRFDKGIDPEVHRACAEFAAFLRREYFFPIRVPIYFKNTKLSSRQQIIILPFCPLLIISAIRTTLYF